MNKLENLYIALSIEKASWVENQKYWQNLAQIYGGTHPKTLAQHNQVEEIKTIMHKLEKEIKELTNIV